MKKIKKISSLFATSVIALPMIVSCTNQNTDENILDINKIANSYNNKIKPNEVGKNTYTAILTSNNINNYVTGLPQGDHENDVKSEIIFVEQTNPNEGVITIFVRFIKNDRKKDFKYVVKGFKKTNGVAPSISELEFDNKVNLVNLIAKPNAKNALITSINANNVRNYVDGFPETDFNFNMEIQDVKPKLNNSENKILLITLKMWNPNETKLKITKTYEVGDFLPIYKKGFEEIEKILKKYPLDKIKANDAGKQIFVDELTHTNIHQYVDGLAPRKSDNGVKLTIFEIKKDKAGEGIAKLEIQFTYEMYTRGLYYPEIPGFKKRDAVESEKEFNQKVEAVNLIANSNAATVMANDVTIDNVKNYVDGIPSSDTTLKVEVIDVKPNENTKLVVKLKFSHPYFTKLVKTKEFVVDGFKSNENLEFFKKEIKNSSFSKLKGKDNIFARKDLINDDRFAFGLPHVGDWNWSFTSNDNQWITMKNAINFLFVNSDFNNDISVQNKHLLRWNLSTDENYTNAFGKTLNELKSESNLFSSIKEVAIELILTPVAYLGDYQSIGMHPYFKFELDFSLVITQNTNEKIKIENIWNKPSTVYFCNDLNNNAIKRGTFVYMPSINDWTNQDPNTNWNKLLNNDSINAEKSIVITNENGIKITLSRKNLPNDINRYSFKNKAKTLDFKIVEPTNTNEITFVLNKNENIFFYNEDDLSDIVVTLKDQNNNVQEIKTLSNKLELGYTLNKYGYYQLTQTNNWIGDNLRQKAIEKAYYKIINEKMDNDVEEFVYGNPGKGKLVSSFVDQLSSIKNPTNIILKKVEIV